MVQREETVELRDGQPSPPGTYALVMRFSKRLEILVVVTASEQRDR